MKKTSLGFLSLSLIITYLVLSTNIANFRIMHYAYAQTNAVMLATLVSTNNSSKGSVVAMDATASGGAAYSTSSITTATSTSNTVQRLQIKESVNYFDSASGYLAYPSNSNNNSSNNPANGSAMTISKKLPAVIMIHENRGLNDYIKSMANTLAREGYVVLGVDLFKGQVAQTSQQAQQLASFARNNPATTISNLQAAVNYVSSLPFVDSSKIASIGWCFGGGQSLQLALHSEQHPLVATI